MARVGIADRLVGRMSPERLLKKANALADARQWERAFPLFAQLADGGLVEAQYRVGRCYLEGAGVPFSRIEAARWLERASGHGFVEAQATLAGL